MKIAKLFSWVVIALWCTGAHAGLRCDGDIADIGDPKASVLMKCGQPFFTEAFCKPPHEFFVPVVSDEGTTINVLPCVPVEEWTYNPGSGQFMTIMRFEAGTMTSIRYGARIP